MTTLGFSCSIFGRTMSQSPSVATICKSPRWLTSVASPSRRSRFPSTRISDVGNSFAGFIQSLDRLDTLDRPHSFAESACLIAHKVLQVGLPVLERED